MDYDGSAKSAIYISLLRLHAVLRLCRDVGIVIDGAAGCTKLHAICCSLCARFVVVVAMSKVVKRRC